MSIFGKDGFIRQQEIAFAKKLITWQYERAGAAIPGDSVLTAHAKQVVDQAHIITKKSGRNLFEIIKESVEKIRQKKN